MFQMYTRKLNYYTLSYANFKQEETLDIAQYQVNMFFKLPSQKM